MRKIFSNHWKTGEKFFQSLENLPEVRLPAAPHPPLSHSPRRNPVNWKKKLLLDFSVFLFSATVCLTLHGLMDDWLWRQGWHIVDMPRFAVWLRQEFFLMLLWPLFRWCFARYWAVWYWLALAAGLLVLFIRQFIRSDRLSAWLGAASVALWWVAGLVWAWSSWACD